jgi:hypothetical protein
MTSTSSSPSSSAVRRSREKSRMRALRRQRSRGLDEAAGRALGAASWKTGSTPDVRRRFLEAVDYAFSIAREMAETPYGRIGYFAMCLVSEREPDGASADDQDGSLGGNWGWCCRLTQR